MKKVLIIAAAISLLAAPALALSISESAHDLSSGSTDAGYNGDAEGICVYCHTPHGARAVTNAPLWNRTDAGTTFAAADIYNSLSIESETKSVVDADIQATDALLCLSCHDGASLGTSLANPPNTGYTRDLTTQITGDANIGTDLSNDHPIGFSYSAVYTEENGVEDGLNTVQAATSVGKVRFYGSSEEMWCSSCHDVHDNADAPFLNTTNAGSELCLACHNK